MGHSGIGDVGGTAIGLREPSPLPTSVELPESAGYRLKRRMLGRPLVSEQLHAEKLSNPTALGVLGIDMISSSAYGSEQMLTQLVPYFGLAGFMLVMPITGIILALMILLTFCYRDLIIHYTKAGGSYVVAREQFGVKVAQIAAVALLIDYVVTVAVQTAAGTDAIASWLTFTYNVNIDSWKIWISIAVVLILAYGNLRGIREAGRSFALPAFFYIVLAGYHRRPRDWCSWPPAICTTRTTCTTRTPPTRSWTSERTAPNRCWCSPRSPRCCAASPTAAPP